MHLTRIQCGFPYKGKHLFKPHVSFADFQFLHLIWIDSHSNFAHQILLILSVFINSINVRWIGSFLIYICLRFLVWHSKYKMLKIELFSRRLMFIVCSFDVVVKKLGSYCWLAYKLSKYRAWLTQLISPASTYQYPTLGKERHEKVHQVFLACFYILVPIVPIVCKVTWVLKLSCLWCILLPTLQDAFYA